jgi:hypothetical protein
VRIETTSDPGNEKIPSTKGQWDLLRMLERELKKAGAAEVTLDKHGYLIGRFPSSGSGGKELPVIGLMAHVDTSSDMSGRDVKPRISNTYYTDSTIINSFQDEDSKYRVDQIKNPFSIALGIVYYLNEKNTQIYFTSEFFNKIPTYLIIDGTQVIRSEQDNYDKGTSFSSYKYGTKSIINYAVGFKQVLSSNFDLMLGFRTDFNAYEVSSEGSFKDINEIQNIHSDLFHFTVGSNFNYKKKQFILGFQYTYGKQDNTKNDINTENNSVYDTAGINNKDMVYTLNSLGLFLGFSLKF